MEGEEEAPVETQEAPVEETPEPEVPAEETPPPAKTTLDELLSNQPEWLRAHKDALEGAELTEDDIKALGHEGQKVVAALLKRAEAGLPELETHQKSLKTKEQELEARERMLNRRSVEQLKPLTDPRFKQFVESLAPAAGAEEPERGSDEWFDWKVDQRTAKRLDEMYSTFKRIEDDGLAAAKAADEKAAQDAQDAEDIEYINANPEISEDPRIHARMQTLVQKHNHSIPDAHKIALRELVTEDETKVRQDALARSRERIVRGGQRGGVLGPTPEDPDEAEKFYQQYPDARKRDYAILFPHAAPQD